VIDLPPPNYQQTVEALVRCEVPRANIKIVYQDYLQSDEVSISDLGEVTDQKLRCVKTAVHSFYILMLENQAQQVTFYEFSEREDRPRWKAEALETLRSRGLIGRLPNFDPTLGVQAFGEALEGACGLHPRSAIRATETV
jgi:hypothetical protein